MFKIWFSIFFTPFSFFRFIVNKTLIKLTFTMFFLFSLFTNLVNFEEIKI